MAQQRRRLSPEDVTRIIRDADETRQLFERDHDRPDSKFVKPSVRVPPEVKRAKGRFRTAHSRSSMDKRRAPSTRDVGMALAVALATTPGISELTSHDLGILDGALHDLHARGFSIEEAKATMRRLRIRMLDPADRQGEASESTGDPIRPASWGPIPF